MELDLRLASSTYTSIMSYALSHDAHQELLDGLEEDLKAANAEEFPPGAAPPHAPVHLPQAFTMAGLFDIQGHGQMLFIITVLPFALMGLCAIFLSFFPDASSTGGRVKRAQLAVRRFLGKPLPPFGFWRRWTHGLCIGEALLFTWAFAPQLWFTIASFNYSRWVWDSGHATHVYELTHFNKAQFWLRWTAMQGAVWFLSKTPFIFIPVCRGSLITSFLGVGYDKAIKFHRWMGYHLVVAMFLHGFLLQALFASGGVFWAMMTEWKYIEGVSNLAGVVAWVACVVLAVGTQIRRINYWLFYHSHVASVLLIIVFLSLHINFVGCFAYGFMVWGIDVVYRLVQASHAVDVTASVGANGKVVTLLIPIEEGVKYEDGSHVWVNVPQVSRVQFHPFTVASTQSDPHDDGHIRLHIKVFNRWTKGLSRLASEQQQLQARVQGPFDGHQLSADDQTRLSDMAFFVGGVGMTAVSGTIHRCAVQRAEGRMRHGDPNFVLPPVHVVYAFSDADELATLVPLLPYARDISLTLHYTGKAPLPASVAIAEPQAALRPSKAASEGPAPARRALVPRVASRWQLLLVWLVAAAICMWIIALPDSQILQSRTVLVQFRGRDVQYFSLWVTSALLLAAFAVTAAVIVPIHILVRCLVSRRAAAAASRAPAPPPSEDERQPPTPASDSARKSFDSSVAGSGTSEAPPGSIRLTASASCASLGAMSTSQSRALGRSVSTSSFMMFNPLAYSSRLGSASDLQANALDGPLSDPTADLDVAEGIARTSAQSPSSTGTCTSELDAATATPSGSSPLDNVCCAPDDLDPQQLYVQPTRRDSDFKLGHQGGDGGDHVALTIPETASCKAGRKSCNPPMSLAGVSEALIVETAHGSVLTLPGASVEVAINTGRPDLLAWLYQLRGCEEQPKPLGVWTAGHPAMCASIHQAVFSRKWGHGVELHESTFEL